MELNGSYRGAIGGAKPRRRPGHGIVEGSVAPGLSRAEFFAPPRPSPSPGDQIQVALYRINSKYVDSNLWICVSESNSRDIVSAACRRQIGC